MSIFTNAKDETRLLDNSFVVYKFTCPGCNIDYIGKTECTLNESMEHAWSDKNSAINTHIDNCEGINHINSINNIFLEASADNRKCTYFACAILHVYY